MRVPFVVLFLVFLPIYSAAAQRQSTSELLSLYLKDRAFELAARDVRQRGGRIATMPLADMPLEDDRVERWLRALYPPGIPSTDSSTFAVDSIEPVSRVRRPVHESRFRNTAWAFAGSQSRSTLDTLLTREIRSRMQAQFGSPSRLVIDMDSVETRHAAEVIQFEYWFVVNDSIPVMVVDVNGPWDRGIVVAAPASIRARIRDLKEALLMDVGRFPLRAPWADYYYNAVKRMWYITGYDGAMYFDERIGRPVTDLGPPSIVPFLEKSNR